jgi:hypothetical protein
MVARSLAALVLAAGCSAKVGAPDCRQAVAQASARLGGEVEHGVAMCERDAWSPELRQCVAVAATQDDLLACMAKFQPVHPAPRPGPRVASEPAVEAAQRLVRSYARDAYPLWRAHHGAGGCPASIHELDDLMSGIRTDPWGHDPVMLCGADHPPGVEFGVLSLGLDGQRGTADDIRSW